MDANEQEVVKMLIDQTKNGKIDWVLEATRFEATIGGCEFTCFRSEDQLRIQSTINGVLIAETIHGVDEIGLHTAIRESLGLPAVGPTRDDVLQASLECLKSND